MYGPDIERLISSISTVVDSARHASYQLSLGVAKPMHTQVDGATNTITPGSHGHPDGSHSHAVSAHEHNEVMMSVACPMIDSDAFRAEMQKISIIEGQLYIRSTSLNNSIGSPYTELSALVRYLSAYSEIADSRFIGETVASGMIVHDIMNVAIDAKYAVLQYHDGLQRGYDACVNGGKSSVQWDDFIKGTTDGNVGKK